jgi:Protein of unknown function (DUF1501)
MIDPVWAALLGDLAERGLLDTTLVVWMGEFGRTPRMNPQQGRINQQQGRDHFPNAWSTVLCGGGIKGGTIHGKTSPDGMATKDGPATVPDFLATVAKALGVDPTTQNISNIGSRSASRTSAPDRSRKCWLEADAEAEREAERGQAHIRATVLRWLLSHEVPGRRCPEPAKRLHTPRLRPQIGWPI